MSEQAEFLLDGSLALRAVVEILLELRRLGIPLAEEFEQYFHYCEECKAAVKQKLGML